MIVYLPEEGCPSPDRTVGLVLHTLHVVQFVAAQDVDMSVSEQFANNDISVDVLPSFLRFLRLVGVCEACPAEMAEHKVVEESDLAIVVRTEHQG